jgi:small subunit ribosomal protein S4
MARYTGPRNRIARRFGVNIFGRARNPLLHKANPPGQHGAKRKKKSDFGIQLDEQQKLRAVYGMLSRKQLMRYYEQALGSPINTTQVFLQQLECRLDNIVYRLKLAPTIFAAQQMVSHGHVLVNGKKVDRRSFQVKPGMTVSLKPKAQQLAIVKQAQESTMNTVPEYLSWDESKFSGQLMVLPGVDQVPLPLPINLPLVCEYLAFTG